MEVGELKEKKINRLITVVSILVPVVVVALFGVKIPNMEPLSFLPPIYASINGITAVVLVIAVWAVKSGKRELHQKLMTIAIGLSLLFLLMYIAYHMTSDSTAFGGQGTIKYVYYSVLISHILLSIGIIPLVLRTYAYAHLKRYGQHRRWAKITFPIWLYVAVSGVLVYLMISPYYVC